MAGATRSGKVMGGLSFIAAACGGSGLRSPEGAPNSPAADRCARALSWVRELSSESDASIRRLAALRTGGVIAVAGLVTKAVLRGDGKCLATFEPRGESDALVMSLTTEGHLAWARRIGAPSSRVEPQAVLVRPDGSIVVAGSYYGAPVMEGAGGKEGVTLPPTSKQDALRTRHLFLAFYDGNGTPERAAVSNDTGLSSWVADLAAAGDDVVIAGTFSGELEFGAGAGRMKLVSKGDEDAFVVRIDGNGQPRWARRLGGSGSDTASALGVTAQGSIYVAGTFSKRSGQTADAPLENGITFSDRPETLAPLGGRRDAFVAAIDGAGRLLGWTALGGEEESGLGPEDRVVGLGVRPDGDAVILGDAAFPMRFGASGTTPATARAKRGSFLARVAPDGKVRWALPLGAVEARGIGFIPGGDWAVSARASGRTVYPIAGKKRSTLSIGELEDMLLARHAPDGTLRWVARFGGDGGELGEGVAADPTGALFAAGRLYRDFAIERDGCPALPVQSASRHHPNSFILRIPPGGDPSNEARERRIEERRGELERLRAEAAEADRTGNQQKACARYEAITTVAPDEPGAWVDLGACLARLDQQDRALTAYRKALELGSRHHDAILEAHQAARQKAYLGLEALESSVALPADGDCAELAPAPGCAESLWACTGPVGSWSARAARIGTSREHAEIPPAIGLFPVMPALGVGFIESAETWSRSHHWFARRRYRRAACRRLQHLPSRDSRRLSRADRRRVQVRIRRRHRTGSADRGRVLPVAPGRSRAARSVSLLWHALPTIIAKNRNTPNWAHRNAGSESSAPVAGPTRDVYTIPRQDLRGPRKFLKRSGRMGSGPRSRGVGAKP